MGYDTGDALVVTTPVAALLAHGKHGMARMRRFEPGSERVNRWRLDVNPPPLLRAAEIGP